MIVRSNMDQVSIFLSTINGVTSMILIGTILGQLKFEIVRYKNREILKLL